MQYRLSLTTFAILVCLLPGAAALGQTVYRCGDSYNQAPCPGATSLDVDDSRSALQKAQADAATAAARRAASAMEHERLARERTPEASKLRNTAGGGSAHVADSPVRKVVKKSKPAPLYFTAGVPAEKSKDKAKKSSAKADTADKAGTATTP